MSLITQPPQATITFTDADGKQHEVAGTEEDIAWLADLFQDLSHTKGGMLRFIIKRIRRFEHNEFSQCVRTIEFVKW